MKRGFTLIELMIVIIIIGVLATVGIVQYQAAVEKSRSAEAKSVIAYLRSQCAAIWMENSSTDDCDNTRLNIGTNSSAGQIPSSCAGTHYFTYGVSGTSAAGSAVNFTATRCTSGGKTPDGKNSGHVNLSVDYAAGTDTWKMDGGY